MIVVLERIKKMKDYLLKSTSIQNVLRFFQNNENKTCLILNDDKTIYGFINDEDLREYLSNKTNLISTFKCFITSKTIFAKDFTSDEELIKIMKSNNIDVIPIVDKNMKCKEVKYLNRISKNKLRSSKNNFDFAVIMAGGIGKRLLPLTKNTPKSLIKVNDRTILERQIEYMVKKNIKNIYISINYLGHIITKHIGSGKELNANINYIYEDKSLDTAGALSLIKGLPKKPILIINGDILTNLDYDIFYNHHMKTKSDITVGSIPLSHDVPYGVIDIDDKFNIRSIKEKPQYNYLCNAGVYIFSPEVLNLMKASKKISMTDFIEYCISKGLKITTFPIYEKWYDIGNIKDLKKAEMDSF